MTKKEVKDKIKHHQEAVNENIQDLNLLEVLQPAPASSTDELPSQSVLKRLANIYTSEKAFNLSLKAPSIARYTINGSHMLIASKDGQISSFGVQNLIPRFERELNERIYDAAFLHSEEYFALAQKEALYIYDVNGVELHAVRDVERPRTLTFLPYHFLLACTTVSGKLKYLDTSRGAIVADIKLPETLTTSVNVNPSNAVLYLGSSRGTVSLWAPAQESAVMTISCGKSAITGVDMDRNNTTMLTAAIDGEYSLFDIRSVYKPLRTINTNVPIQRFTLSQNRVAVLGSGRSAMLFQDLTTPLGSLATPGNIETLAFCPHEDIMSIGHASGVTSYIVPGCGDPRYDSSEITPFMSKTQRKSKEVQRLLDKIPYDLISHDQILGHLMPKPVEATQTKERKPRYYEQDSQNGDALSRFRQNK